MLNELLNIEEKSTEVADLLKVLGHPKRLLLMCLLSEGEKNVTEISKLTKLGQSQASQYLGDLERRNLLTVRPSGKNRYYQIKEPKILELIKSLSEIFC